MPSTFTTNSGIEKPGNGEQSGSWGITVNTNMDILDRTVNGVVSITLTGTSSTLTTANGSLSNGQYRVLLLGGVLSATHTITIDPSDAQKIYYVKNSTGQTVTFTQGSGAVTADVPNGGFGIVFADGSDECVNLTDSSSISSLVLGGTAVTTTGAELNVIDGNTSATSTTVTGTDSIVFNDNGVMKQVSMNDINTFIQSGVGNGTVTIQAGSGMSGGGTFQTNQSGNSTITLNSVATANDPTVTLAAGTSLTGGGSFSLNQSGAQTITFNYSAASTTAQSVGSLHVGVPTTTNAGTATYTHNAGSNYAGSSILGNLPGTWRCISPSTTSQVYNYSDNAYYTYTFFSGLYERIS